MSTEALFWALKQKTDRPAENLVLIHLADRAGHNDTAFPSLAYLCEKTNLNRRTVISSIDGLESKGLIFDTGQRKGISAQIKVNGLKISGTYSLGTEKETVAETLPLPQTVQKSTRDSAVLYSKECINVHTDTISDTKEDTKTYEPIPEWLPKELLDDFKAHRKTLKCPMTDRSLKLFIREVTKLKDQGYDPVECIETAILNGWKSVYAPKTLPTPSRNDEWVTK